MESPVEQTQTLVALHNMHEEKLRSTLKLGAWPSPSIAIVQAATGHADYGAYSAVFPRSTIDPEADYRNRVYGSDAWTPTGTNAPLEYGSVEEIHADEGRLHKVPDDEYKQILADLDAELMDVSADIMATTEAHSSNRFEEQEIIGYIISQAAAGKRTAASIKSTFAREGYTITTEQAKNIKRCSILREINIEYGNSISYPNTGKTDNQSENYQ